MTLSINPPDSQATSTAVFHYVFLMQENGTVRLRNGRTGFVRWNPHNPRQGSTRTKIAILVFFKPGRTDSGMVNVSPSFSVNSVLLCEITLA